MTHGTSSPLNGKEDRNSLTSTTPIREVLLLGPVVVLTGNYWQPILIPKPQIVALGALEIGKVDLRQGPFIPDEELLIRIPLRNLSTQDLGFAAQRQSLVFNDTELDVPKNTVSKTLMPGEVVYLQFPGILKTMQNNTRHKFALSFTVDYGPAEGLMQRRAIRAQLCSVPIRDFNSGICGFLRDERLVLQ